MSHSFCGTEAACGVRSGHARFPELGWASWHGTAIYIRAIIDDSVQNKQACGEAIHRWNDQVGPRFLLTPDKGDVEIHFFEKTKDEPPFNYTPWFVDGKPAAGFALNHDKNGRLLGVSAGRIARSDIYIRKDLDNSNYQSMVNIYAHQIGHAFGLADHPKVDINSVMSHQAQGRWLLGPSSEDVKGIAKIYTLRDLKVRPQDLSGIKNIKSIWHYDRYGKRKSHNRNAKSWTYWISAFLNVATTRSLGSTIYTLEPYETYFVEAKRDGTLGFGRFEGNVFKPESRNKSFRWVYE